MTALAFTHFAREKVDVAVVETGLGGARDATNVISAEELAVAVIVGIGYEHLAALGGTLESIALAKSGIIKENRQWPSFSTLRFGDSKSTWGRIWSVK